MSTLLKLIGIGAIVYVGLLVALYLMQRSMIYLPDPTRPVPAAFGVPDMTPMTLTTEDGLSLLAWWKPPAESTNPVIVYFHGNGGHIGYRGGKVRPYLDRGYGVLLVSWRGYSGNKGKPTEAGLYADGEAALSFVEEQGIPPARRVLYGESLGGGVAVELAVRDTAAALVLEAPFTSIMDAAAGRFPMFPSRWLIKDRFDSLAKIHRVSMPLLVLHGERDRVLPARMGRELLAAANPPKEGVFLPQAGHNNLYDYGAVQYVLRFLEETFAK